MRTDFSLTELIDTLWNVNEPMEENGMSLIKN